jgi:phage tail sheath protein FI
VGQLVIEIGVSIVKPAEFVIFKITQGSSVGPAA